MRAWFAASQHSNSRVHTLTSPFLQHTGNAPEMPARLRRMKVCDCQANMHCKTSH